VPRLRRAFLLGTVALIAVALTLAALGLMHRATFTWVLHTREVIRIANDARALTSDRETGLRGFLLSGNEVSLVPDAAAKPLVRFKVDSLLSMTKKGSSENERAKSIASAIQLWEAGYADPTLARARKAGYAPSTESELAGKALFDNVRGAFDSFQHFEERLYDRLVKFERLVERVGFAAVMAELLLLLVALWGLRRGTLTQASDLIEQQEQLEEQAGELEAQSAELEEQTSMLEEQTEEARSIARALEVTNHELAETVARLEHSNSVVQGVTREKQQTLSLLDVVLETAPIGFAFHDKEMRYTRINPALAAMAGVSAAEHIGRTPAQVHPDVAEVVEPKLQQVLATGEPVINIQLARPSKNGTGVEQTFLLSCFPVKGSSGDTEGVGCVVLETTERRQLEEQLLQAQKMEAVGRLAGGIAHDFNNILTAIKSYSELLIEDMATNEGRVEDVQEIREAADRAANLTRQLLAFSRQQMLRPRVLDLNSTVRDLKSMLDRVIGANIELKTRLSADIGMITADPGQIEQVLMNLVVNASDAMTDGGRIDMETANVELDEEYARTHVATPAGPYVMLCVSDTGHGMTREIQSRVFEPFFTTKEKGKGTGLGLSTVYGIVKQSGGSIWVYSEPGRGTTFKIYLPRVNETADLPVAVPVTNGKGGDETILLVEDEDAVREVASRILRRHGYTVVEARNGTDALRKFREDGSEFDLIVTDIVMPEMGGLELAQRVREWTPNARILFTSGYTEDAVLRRNFLDPGAEFVEKPFTPSRLAQRTREVLDGPVPVLNGVGNGH
jgi:two-component system cell cycle sensor histidine kinase/response regulator CckA